MECDLEYHEETWDYSVSYQGLTLSLTIHRDLDEPHAPYDWGVSENRRGMDTPVWWTESEFSNHEDALAGARRWILENVRDGRMPTEDEATKGASVDLG